MTARNVFLLLARLVGGGALLLAGGLKLSKSFGPVGPKTFALSIDSFGILPAALVDPVAWFLPWFEIVMGLALVLGIWARQAGLLSSGLYLVFTGALAMALIAGKDVDCGCFGGLFGEATVGWHSVARNMVFIAATLSATIFGAGKWALESPEAAPNIAASEPT